MDLVVKGEILTIHNSISALFLIAENVQVSGTTMFN